MVKDLGKKAVVVLFNGRPLILDNILEADAILESWFLGSKAADAITDILVGDCNPSGKLTMSFPRSLGQIPVYYNHLSTGRPYLGEDKPTEFTSRYMDLPNTPLFPFGFGLSYSKFVYHNFRIDKTVMDPTGSIKVRVTVANESEISGKEIVQLYIRDYCARISRPEKELKQFKKIELEAHCSAQVAFDITLSDLTYTVPDGKTVFDLGKFNVMVGSDSVHLFQADFILQ
jgi:beta-glucosidase